MKRSISRRHAVSEILESRRLLSVFYSQSLAIDPGWSVEGEWAFGQPQGLGNGNVGHPDPNSGHTGYSVYGVNLAGDYDLYSPGPFYLTTPQIDCTGQAGISLSFWRFLNTDQRPYVTATVEYSTDGTNWSLLYQNPSNRLTSDASWNQQEYALDADADNSAHLQLRWGYSVPLDWAFPMSGWNIDDIELSGSAATVSPPPTSIALGSSSDTGLSSTDGITRLDNSSAGFALAFSVSGLTAGATVKLYADGNPIGSATASADSATVFTDGSFDLADGDHFIAATQTLSGLGESASAGTAIYIDTAAPTFTAMAVNGGNVQRSMVKSLSLQFSEPVALGSSLQLRRSSGAVVGGVALSSPATASDLQTITFSGSAVIGGSLPDGVYSLSIAGSALSDIAGNPMAGTQTRRFHRLFGDSDGDRDVDAVDLKAFKSALNKPAAYNTVFDFDGNGAVNSADYNQFKLRMVRILLK